MSVENHLSTFHSPPVVDVTELTERAERLRGALEPAGVAVDLSEAQVPQQDDDEHPWLFVAVSE
ncbi:hypothetical protein [Streptacidiphilus melanogenes]|uniref:hypothetical protein n=1 Tax=Streptacidiphilus melanogenes TaxID=411235 RepID=UPI0005A86080|nr:hypothetical protein [Streptacidiphilus melanogenes]